MDIRLDDSQLKSLIAEAIYAHMDEAKREALLKGAVAYLLTPQPNSYSGRSAASPLELAFNDAARKVAEDAARAWIESDADMQAKIRGLFAEAAERAFVTQREETVQKIAAALATGLGLR